MNRAEYISLLKRQLRRLPKKDFDKAIEYFEEYFEEAGSENEAQAIVDLGSPESAADQIITDMALSNAKEPVKNVKRGLNAVWIGLLALFAIPIGLPIIFAFVIVIATFILTILLLIASLILSGILVTLIGPFCIAAGFTVLFSNASAFITCLGFGLIYSGVGALITYGMVLVCRAFLNSMVKLFGRVVRKGRKKHE